MLLDYLRGFIRCPSPNPRRDMREAAANIRRFLQRHGAEYRVIAPNEVMPNIVAAFEAGKPGRHLALINGHIDLRAFANRHGQRRRACDRRGVLPRRQMPCPLRLQLHEPIRMMLQCVNLPFEGDLRARDWEGVNAPQGASKSTKIGWPPP